MQTNIQEQYLKVQVQTASPGQLTLLLYQELVRCLSKTRQLAEREEWALGVDLLHKSRSILFELMSTLDMKYDLSKDLYDLYEFYAQCIATVVIERDITLLNEVLDFAKGMLESWKQALQIVKNGKSL